MSCYYPLKGYYSKYENYTGKRNIVFSKTQAVDDKVIEIPCGQCIGCRLEKSKMWAIRCMHEASMYEYNCFVTLTYNDENLPKDRNLEKRHFQLFMKSLRAKLDYENKNPPEKDKIIFLSDANKKLRVFYCGEYGEELQRPHFHAILFNLDFADKEPHDRINGNIIYKSKTLEEVWEKGFCTIGSVSFESAAYVARYVTKKITGSKSDEHYLVKETGLLKQKEFAHMSNRPGIAREWYEKYKGDLYPDDFVIMHEMKNKVPKYYDKRFEIDYPSDFDDVRERRKKDSLKRAADNTYERLQVKEKIKKINFKELKRSYENESK